VEAKLPALPPAAAAATPSPMAGAGDPRGITLHPPPGPEGLVERFRARHRESTRRAYARDLADFARWLGAEDARAAGVWLCASPSPGPANQLVHDYLSHLRRRGLSAATVNRRLSALRALVRLVRSLDLVAWVLDVPGERARAYRDTRGRDVAGARRLAQGLQRPDAKGARDRAILHLLWDLGLRRAEVASLDLEHLDRAITSVEVLEKGEEARIPLTLPEETAAALRAWLEVRGRQPGPLFLSLDRAAGSRSARPQRLSATSIYRELRRLGERVQVRARPHGVRHGAITTVLDLNGGDVRAAQRFSRHKDVRTLLRYDDNRQDLGGKMARLVASAV
jgi:integrase/recombinase XerC